jgi:ribosome-associated protein
MPNSNRGSTGFQSNEFEQEYERPSKSQLKREMTALQKLGAELIAEPRERVKRVPMPEEVRDAILECQTIKDHEGRRRQLQYVGKMMRTLEEEEVALIRNARREQAENKPPKAYREIFQALKQLQGEAAKPAAAREEQDEQDDEE